MTTLVTQDIYYSSEFKKSNETNYNFSIPLDVNLDTKDYEKIKFKLIDFSIINSMLTISNAHQNNKFKLTYLNVDYIIEIPDGSYTPITLKDKLNTLISIPLVFNYDKITNKYYLINTNTNPITFYPQNCALLFGFTKQSYTLINGNNYYSETFVNMLPYTKLLLTTNLTFECNTQNNFESKYSSNTSTGDIICWVSRDVPLFTTINYINNQNIEIEIVNKNIKSLDISIMNEYKELILDAPYSHIHLQLIIYEKIDWYKKFYKLISDIYYSLLSLYFKK